MSFTIKTKDPHSRARLGVLSTPHGEVQTPVYMPVATQASVKAMTQEDLNSIGVEAILSNSYHLYLRPGTEVIAEAGGLHAFMGYDGMILTDSGGFQVWSLSDLREVDDEGVTFKSHIDGSAHRLTAEKVIQVQSALGSDCWTTLDECPPYPSTEAQTEQALRRTMAWTDRSAVELRRQRDAGKKSLFFPIVQGGFFPKLRERAAAHLETVPWDGASLGGFSLGEPKDLTWATLEATTAALPEAKPRYLMGVGTPKDVWEAVERGVDMMDCVFPTRAARNGMVMTRRGRYNIGVAANTRDRGPLDEGCSCFVCARYSRSYLRHLFKAKELSMYRYISYHNLHFMAETMGMIRKSLADGRFVEAKREYLEAYG